MSVAAVDTFASLDIPPGPKGLPLVGCAPQVKRDTLGFFADFAARYDGIASLRVGLDTVYVLNSPDALEHVFVSNWRNYRKSDFYNKVRPRSEEHTSEIQSLMRNSYADFFLKKNRECRNVAEYWIP